MSYTYRAEFEKTIRKPQPDMAKIKCQINAANCPSVPLGRLCGNDTRIRDLLKSLREYGNVFWAEFDDGRIKISFYLTCEGGSIVANELDEIFKSLAIALDITLVVEATFDGEPYAKVCNRSGEMTDYKWIWPPEVIKAMEDTE